MMRYCKILFIFFLFTSCSLSAQNINKLDSLVEDSYSDGKYDSSFYYINKKIDLLEQSIGKTDTTYGFSLYERAVICWKMGSYTQSEIDFLASIKVFDTAIGKENRKYSDAINDLAGLYNFMGNYDKAEANYREALGIREKILGKKNQLYANSLNNLGNLYIGEKRFKEAEPLLLEAIAINKEIKGDTNVEYASYLINSGFIYMSDDFKDYKKAESQFNQAATIFKKNFGEMHPKYAIATNALADLYSKIGDYEKAEPLFLQSIKIRKQTLGENHPHYASSLRNLANMYVRMGAFDKAEPLYLESVHTNLKIIHDHFSFLSESEKEKYWATFRQDFESMNTFCFQRYKSNPAIAGELYNINIATKGLLLNSSFQIKNNILKSNDTSLVNLYNHWTLLKQDIGKYSTMDKSKIESMKINLDSLTEVANSIEKDLNKKSTAFSDVQKISSASWQSIQQNLKKDEAAVEFIKFNKVIPKVTDSVLYCALIVRPGYTNPKLVYLFEESQLEDVLNKMVSNRGVQILEQPVTKEKSRVLFDLIWQPVDSLLKGIKTVFISPVGLLYKVSFASFTNADSKFLFDKYNLKILTCTHNVKSENKSLMITPDFNSVIYGGIDYTMDPTKQVDMAKNYKSIETSALLAFNDNPSIKDKNRGGQWNYLQGTLTEANSIIQEFQKSKIPAKLISADQAIEESFKSLSGKSPTIIHIATHGFYFANNDDQNPSNSNENEFKKSNDPLFRSGLIMAGANRVWTGNKNIEGLDDGILTAYEVSLLDLSNTKLVVLSACETGLGEIKGSEGVYGLQRAFKMAGVDYLIITLWEIRDEVTVEFMSSFYQQWLKGKDIFAAFKFAQDEMRKKYEANYWAAFVLLE